MHTQEPAVPPHPVRADKGAGGGHCATAAFAAVSVPRMCSYHEMRTVFALQLAPASRSSDWQHSSHCHKDSDGVSGLWTSLLAFRWHHNVCAGPRLAWDAGHNAGRDRSGMIRRLFRCAPVNSAG